MDNNIVGKPHLQYVQDQIKTRQEILGKNSRSSADITWMNGRTSWVRLASSVDIRDENIAIFNTGSQEWESVSNNGAEFRSKYLGLSEYSGNELSSQIVLQGGVLNASGTQKFGVSETNSILPSNSSNYGFGGTEFGLQAMPGIVSFSSKTNNKGSLRFANLTIRANNKKQFEYIEASYLRLGYTMLLEWGNSSYPKIDPATNATTYEINRYSLVRDFLDNPPTGAKGTQYFYTQIENYRKKSQGNYDGFLGKVENFSWEFTKEGYYLINLKLITIGSVVESLKVNVIQNRLIGQVKGEKKKEYQKVNSLLKTIHLALTPIPKKQSTDLSFFTGVYDPLTPGSGISTAFVSWLFDATTETNYEFFPIKTDYLVLSNLKKDATDEELENASTKVYACAALFGEDAQYNYIRFGNLLDILNTNFLIYGEEEGEPILFKLDTSEEQYCFSSKINISSDPTKLIVRFKGNILQQEIEIFDEPGRQIEPFHSQVEGVDVGIIPNIYFSYELLESIITTNTDEETGSLDLYKFLKSLLNEANLTLGGVNKLNLRIVDKNLGTEEEPQIQQVVEFYDEVSPFEVEKLRKTKEEEPSFKIYGFGETVNDNREGNFVLDYQFRTELSKNLSTMIAIGAQANGQSVGEDATLLSKWNYGLVDRVLPQKLDIDKVIKKADETTQGYLELISLYQDYLNLFTGALESGSATLEENNVDTLPGVAGGPIIDFVANATGYQFPNCSLTGMSKDPLAISLSGFTETQRTIFNKFYSLEAVGRKLPTPFIGFLPVGFTLTIDGLSGLRIFDRLKIDSRYLPPNYGETLDFIITQLDHKIENNKWITVLGTQSIPKLFGNKLNLDFQYLLSQLAPVTTGFEDLVGAFSYNYSTLGNLFLNSIQYKVDRPGIFTGDQISLNSNGNCLIPGQNLGKGFYPSPLVEVGNSRGYGGDNGSGGWLRVSVPGKGLVTSKGLYFANAPGYRGTNGSGTWHLAEPAALKLLEFAQFLEKNGKSYQINSCFRTYVEQKNGYNKNPKTHAKPGASPHGLGGAIDIQQLIARNSDGKLTSNPSANQAFRTTNEDYKFWAKHAPTFGWYNPQRLRDGVGQDETWHWEFWGVPGEQISIKPPQKDAGVLSSLSELFDVKYLSSARVPDNNGLNVHDWDVYTDSETGKVIKEKIEE